MALAMGELLALARLAHACKLPSFRGSSDLSPTTFLPMLEVFAVHGSPVVTPIGPIKSVLDRLSTLVVGTDPATWVTT
jgi:hypothetical protein